MTSNDPTPDALALIQATLRDNSAQIIVGKVYLGEISDLSN